MAVILSPLSTLTVLGDLLAYALHDNSLQSAYLIVSCLVVTIIFSVGRHHRSRKRLPASDSGACTKKQQLLSRTDRERGHSKQARGGLARSSPSGPPDHLVVPTRGCNFGRQCFAPDITADIRRHPYPFPFEPNITYLPLRTTYTRHLSESNGLHHPGVIVRGELLRTSLSKRHIKTYESLGSAAEVVVA
ncbi:MAG: hypothetical protein M1812_007608 [Candelaria pacifica]|nr:MAG: hypothetical protein M1812_007608 [Candelaria pacifica]